MLIILIIINIKPALAYMCMHVIPVFFVRYVQ